MSEQPTEANLQVGTFLPDATDTHTSCTISCIIPCHNASTSIKTSLKALEESSLSPYEIICVNDASTDDTCGKIQAFAASSTLQIRCITPSPVQRGAAAARNSGATQAVGEYCLFMDADVVVESETIARMMRHLSEQQFSAVVALYRDYSFHPSILAHFQAYMVNSIYTRLDPLHCPCLGTQCVLMKTSLFRTTDGFDEGYTSATVEDFEFGYRLQAEGMQIGIACDAHIVHNHIYTLKTFSRNYYTKSRDLAALLLTQQKVTLSSTGYYDRSNILFLLLLLLDTLCLVAGLAFSSMLLWLLCGTLLIHVFIWGPFSCQVAQRRGWKASICFLILRALVVAIGWVGVAVALLQVVFQNIFNFGGQCKGGVRKR